MKNLMILPSLPSASIDLWNSNDEKNYFHAASG